jgi:hypothetical protein
LATIVLFIVAGVGVAFAIPPPFPGAAELPARVLETTVSLPLLAIPPPREAEFPATVLEPTMSVPKLKRPPPEPADELLLTVLALSLSVLPLKIAPPLTPAESPSNVQLETVTVLRA